MDETEGWFKGLGPPGLCRAFVTSSLLRLEIAPIEQFAHLIVPLVTERVFPDRVSHLEAVIYDQAFRTLDESGGYRPETDYLVLAGDPISISVSVLAASTFSRKLTLLRYDTRTGCYWPFRLNRNVNP